MFEVLIGGALVLLQSIGFGVVDYRFKLCRNLVLFLKSKTVSIKDFNASYASFLKQTESISLQKTDDYKTVVVKNKEDLNEIIDMSMSAFGEIKSEYGKRRELFHHWFDISPNSFVLLRKSGISIGYCVVFPSNQRTFRKYLNGKVSLYQFDEDNINTPIKEDDFRYIYLHSIYIKKPFRKFPLSFSLLINSVYMVTHNFFNVKEPFKNVIFTEPLSIEGGNLVRNFGFTRYEDDVSFDGHEIFHLDFSTLNNRMHKFRLKAQKHLDLIVNCKN